LRLAVVAAANHAAKWVTGLVQTLVVSDYL